MSRKDFHSIPEIAGWLLSAVLACPILAAPPPGAGYGVIGSSHGNHQQAFVKHPEVRFVGRITFSWKTIEPEEGRYDWSGIDRLLKIYKKEGKKAGIQINTPVPDWVFHHVACVGTSRGGRAPQYWDPEYFRLYDRLIKAFADHYGKSSFRDTILCVRLQFNALNTEITSFDSQHLQGEVSRDRSKWTLPANGHAYGPDLTPRIEEDYVVRVSEAYLRHFFAHGIPVTLRMDADNSPRMTGLYDRWTDDPLAWIVTTHYGIRKIADYEVGAFRRRCRERGTPGYGEQYTPFKENGPWSDGQSVMRDIRIPGDGGTLKTHRLTAEQAYYWTMLMLLDWGFSHIAVFEQDHRWAHEHPSLVRVMELVNRYAGWSREPAKSPGAWIALGQFHGFGQRARKENNWGYFIEQEDLEKTSSPVYLAGEEASIHGAWARRLTGPMRLALNPKFATSLKQACSVSLIWLNEPETAWRATAGTRNLPPVQSDGSGRWREIRLEIPSGTLAQDAVLRIEPLKGQPALHLVEIRRATPQLPTGPP